MLQTMAGVEVAEEEEPDEAEHSSVVPVVVVVVGSPHRPRVFQTKGGLTNCP